MVSSPSQPPGPPSSKIYHNQGPGIRYHRKWTGHGSRNPPHIASGPAFPQVKNQASSSHQPRKDPHLPSSIFYPTGHSSSSPSSIQRYPLLATLPTSLISEAQHTMYTCTITHPPLSLGLLASWLTEQPVCLVFREPPLPVCCLCSPVSTTLSTEQCLLGLGHAPLTVQEVRSQLASQGPAPGMGEGLSPPKSHFVSEPPEQGGLDPTVAPTTPSSSSLRREGHQAVTPPGFSHRRHAVLSSLLHSFCSTKIILEAWT